MQPVVGVGHRGGAGAGAPAAVRAASTATRPTPCAPAGATSTPSCCSSPPAPRSASWRRCSATRPRDPAVVCVDEAGRFASPSAAATPAAPTTWPATWPRPRRQARGHHRHRRRRRSPRSTSCPASTATGDVAGVTAACSTAAVPVVDERELPLAGCRSGRSAATAPSGVVVTDRVGRRRPAASPCCTRPSLVAGVGRVGDAAAGARSPPLLEAALAEAGLARAVGRRGGHHRPPGATTAASRRLGLPVRRVHGRARWPPSTCRTRARSSRPRWARRAWPRPPPCSPPAPAPSWSSTKQAGNDVATVAIARRAAPAGHLPSSGSGPGAAAHRTPARPRRRAAGRGRHRLRALRRPVRRPADRRAGGGRAARSATSRSGPSRRWPRPAAGRRVALVCSGDAGVYAMASIALEPRPGGSRRSAGDRHRGRARRDRRPGRRGAPRRAPRPRPRGHQPVRPAHAVGRDRGAPAGRRRGRPGRRPLQPPLAAAGRGSSTRPAPSCSSHRPARHAGRRGHRRRPRRRSGCRPPRWRTSTPTVVGMTTCVVVGSSTTRVLGGRMVTPRGYARDRVPDRTDDERARSRTVHRVRAVLITCPERALLPDRSAPASLVERCTACLACIEVCPRDAIEIWDARCDRDENVIHPIEAESYRILAERRSTCSGLGPVVAGGRRAHHPRQRRSRLRHTTWSSTRPTSTPAWPRSGPVRPS